MVPGFYGTYWIKHLAQVTVLDKPLDNFWMAKTYRLPENAWQCIEPGKAPTSTTPIGRFNVRSFLTSVQDGATVPANRELALRGIAFDGGAGISDVAVSVCGRRKRRAAAVNGANQIIRMCEGSVAAFALALWQARDSAALLRGVERKEVVEDFLLDFFPPAPQLSPYFFEGPNATWSWRCAATIPE